MIIWIYDFTIWIENEFHLWTLRSLLVAERAIPFVCEVQTSNCLSIFGDKTIMKFVLM